MLTHMEEELIKLLYSVLQNGLLDFLRYPVGVGLETTLANIQPSAPIPLRIYTDDSIAAFQQTVKQLFLDGQDRLLTKRYLKLFLEKVVIKLPRVELVGKSEVVLAILENEKAVRTGGVLTAVGTWLPGTCRCKNYRGIIKDIEMTDEIKMSV